MSEEAPKFVKEANHTFTKGEKIYVIDANEFDIYEAEIADIIDGKYKIHYPEYPDDDFETDKTDRFLVENDANKAIYKQQEEIRLAKDQEEEEVGEE